MWRIAWLLLLAFNVSAEPFATAQIPDARATHCDYEDTTTGEAARVPVVVDTVRGQAPDFRVCKFDVSHWLPGSVHAARMRSYADGFDPSEWTAATLDRPAAATVTLALVGSAAPPPPPPPDPPAHMASDPFAGSGVLTTPWVDYLSASTSKLTQSGGNVAPSLAAESTGSYYGGAATGNNQFSEITIVGSLGSAQTYWTASARISGNNASRSLYQITVTSNAYYLTKVVSGSSTDVASGAGTFNGSSTPVVVRLETEDSGANVVLRAYKDGVQFVTYTDTSSVLTGGQPGLEVYAALGVLTPVTLWSGGNLSSGSTYNESVSETATASESTSTTATRAGAVAEAGSAADANAATMVRAGALTEAGSAADAPVGVVVIARAVSEAAIAADAATGLVTASRAVSEAASAADSQAVTMIRAGAVTEAASAADAAATALQAPVAVSEAATAGDAVSTGAATYEVTMSEAASAADAVSNIATRVASMSEALAAADALSVTAVYGASLSEAASAADATNWGGAVYSTAIAEAGSLQDAVAAALQLLATAAATGSAGDSLSAVITAGVGIAEAAAAVEAASAALSIQAVLLNPASAADVVDGTVPSTYSVDVEEQADAQMMVVATVTPDGSLVLSLVNRYRVPGFGTPYRVAAFGKPYRPH